MIAELHIMQKEADTSGKCPSVNAVNGSEYYTLQSAIKSTAESVRKKDDKNAAKIKQRMENVKVRIGLRSEGRLNMISSNNNSVSSQVIEIDRATPRIPDAFSLPKNSDPYAPNRVQAVPLTQNVDIVFRRFSNESAPARELKRKRNVDDASIDVTSSNTGLSHYDRTGVFHHPEPSNKNRYLIGKIDDGNDIISHNISRLQTILDRRTERTSIATTG